MKVAVPNHGAGAGEGAGAGSPKEPLSTLSQCLEESPARHLLVVTPQTLCHSSVRFTETARFLLLARRVRWCL